MKKYTAKLSSHYRVAYQSERWATMTESDKGPLYALLSVAKFAPLGTGFKVVVNHLNSCSVACLDVDFSDINGNIHHF